MNKNILFLLCLISLNCYSQSFAPAPGQPGSTAIHKDSSIIVNWANGIIISRGYLNIANPSLGNASFGEDSFALGIAEGDGSSVVSLGDGGTATLTFTNAIINLPGVDFAIFENGFADNYTEFAHVEVSSDGINFIRFPSISETPLDSQIDNFTYSDCRYVNNLAGKYRQGYGTPFDLDELIDSIGLDLNSITHVRLIDVVGSIDPSFGTTDSQGTLINDPYPTEFPSGGFDLDAVAVIHEAATGITEEKLHLSISPNPSSGKIRITIEGEGEVIIYSPLGLVLNNFSFVNELDIDLERIKENFIFVEVNSNEKRFVSRVVLLN